MLRAREEIVPATQASESPIDDFLSPATGSQRGRIPELDGLRGLAIMLVLFYHYANFETTRDSLAYYLLLPRNAMWSGVDLFFVLSGFLIGGILIDSKHSPSYFRTFYWRRVHRIFPLYYLMIVTFLAGSFIFPGSFLFAGIIPRWPFVFFVQNFYGYVGSPLWLGPTWSLAVEEQFYLLLPVAVRNLSGRGILALSLLCIAGAPILRIALYELGCRTDQIHTMLPTRADALGLGVLAAILMRSESALAWIRSHAGIAYSYFAILICASATVLKWREPGYTIAVGYTVLVHMYFCLLMLLLVVPPGWMLKTFRMNWLRRLGTISFCLYLIHEPILGSVFRIAGYSQPTISNLSTFLLTAAALSMSLYLAVLSWRFLEHPLNRRAHRLYVY